MVDFVLPVFAGCACLLGIAFTVKILHLLWIGRNGY